MYKKIILFLATVFTFALYCSQPLLVKADEVGYYEETFDSSEFANPFNLQTIDQYGIFGHVAPNPTQPLYVSWFAANTGTRSYTQSGTWSIRLSYEEQATLTTSNTGCSIVFDEPITVKSQTNNWLKSGNGWTRSSSNIMNNYDDITMVVFDFENCNFNLYQGLDPVVTGQLDPNKQRYMYQFRTNLDYQPPQNLSLAISFDPVTNGSISRSQTLNGKQYTSDSLDLHITNNGNNAQFAWFIVPHGTSISFPSSLVESSQGFYGSPTFAFVTDEWIKLGSGAAHTDVLSPCAWHAIAQGYTNQIYHVPWSSMSLQKDVQYDCVVYACLVDNMSNMESPTWSASNLTVSADLSGVTEVYRSTFSISDPADFKAQNEGFGAHPWNPSIDNSGLFNATSAWKDDNGKIMIPGSGSSGFDIGGQTFGYPTDTTMSSMFRDYFSFINSALNCFPRIFLTLLSLGMSGMIVIGIIKVVKG